MISSEKIDWAALQKRFKDDSHVRCIIRGIRSRLPPHAIRTRSGMTEEQYATARRRFCHALEEILPQGGFLRPDPLRALTEFALDDLAGCTDQDLDAEACEDGEDIAALAALMRARTAEPPAVPAPSDRLTDWRIRGARPCRQTHQGALRNPARGRTTQGQLERSHRHTSATAAQSLVQSQGPAPQRREPPPGTAGAGPGPAGPASAAAAAASVRLPLQTLLSEPGFLQSVQEALAGGELDCGTLRAWLQTPAAKTGLPASLARELEALAQEVPAGGAAASSAAAAGPERPPSAPAPAQELAIGAVIDDRYELVEPLGGGGLGEVFKAIDRLAYEQLDPDPFVAVKILKARGQGNQNAVLALQREAHRGRKLAHGNILRVHQFEQDRATGQYFMVTELLEGRSFQSVMDEIGSGQPWEHIAPLIGQVCAGLSHAHKEGIVHSDIKPSNLFVARDGEVKILDFGIAAPVPTASRQATFMDARLIRARSLAYTCPEAFLGQTPHYSDDVYSLACLIYEWLAARPPYARGTGPGTPVPALLALKLGMQVTPIPALSPGQNRALCQALALRRSERTQTIEEFWRSMSAAPAPSSRRRLLAAAMGGALALLVGATGTWMLLRDAGPAAAAGQALCPQASAPGALDAATGAATRSLAALKQLQPGAPEEAQAQARLLQDEQCLRALEAAGQTSPGSVQLLKQIETGAQAGPPR
jgi:hypothetical protein